MDAGFAVEHGTVLADLAGRASVGVCTFEELVELG